jgi:hypothetical protein
VPRECRIPPKFWGFSPVFQQSVGGDQARSYLYRGIHPSRESGIAGLNCEDAELIGVLHIRGDLQALAFEPIEQRAEVMDKRKDPPVNLIDRLDRQLGGLLG